MKTLKLVRLRVLIIMLVAAVQNITCIEASMNITGHCDNVTVDQICVLYCHYNNFSNLKWRWRILLFDPHDVPPVEDEAACQRGSPLEPFIQRTEFWSKVYRENDATCALEIRYSPVNATYHCANHEGERGFISRSVKPAYPKETADDDHQIAGVADNTTDDKQSNRTSNDVIDRLAACTCNEWKVLFSAFLATTVFSTTGLCIALCMYIILSKKYNWKCCMSLNLKGDTSSKCCCRNNENSNVRKKSSGEQSTIEESTELCAKSTTKKITNNKLKLIGATKKRSPTPETVEAKVTGKAEQINDGTDGHESTIDHDLHDDQSVTNVAQFHSFIQAACQADSIFRSGKYDVIFQILDENFLQVGDLSLNRFSECLDKLKGIISTVSYDAIYAISIKDAKQLKSVDYYKSALVNYFEVDKELLYTADKKHEVWQEEWEKRLKSCDDWYSDIVSNLQYVINYEKSNIPLGEDGKEVELNLTKISNICKCLHLIEKKVLSCIKLLEHDVLDYNYRKGKKKPAPENTPSMSNVNTHFSELLGQIHKDLEGRIKSWESKNPPEFSGNCSYNKKLDEEYYIPGPSTRVDLKENDDPNLVMNMPGMIRSKEKSEQQNIYTKLLPTKQNNDSDSLHEVSMNLKTDNSFSKDRKETSVEHNNATKVSVKASPKLTTSNSDKSIQDGSDVVGFTTS